MLRHEKIFEDYGIIIRENDKKYYIQYDAGELVDVVDTVEISKEGTDKAQLSKEDAYNIILQDQNL